MAYRLLSPLPAATSLELITAGATPFVLSRLSPLKPPIDASVTGLFAGGGPAFHELEASLETLAEVGAIERLPGKRGGRLIVTQRGELLLTTYRTLTVWARSISLDPDPAGSLLSWRLIEDLAIAWRKGILIALAGRASTVQQIAATTHGEQHDIANLLDRLLGHGLVTTMGRDGSTWLLTKDLKRSVSALAAAVRMEEALEPRDFEDIRPGHVEIGLRYCFESIGSGHFAPALEGTFAALCDMPDGTRAGVTARFSGGGVYSVNPYREGELLDGGFRGDIAQIINLVALGQHDSVRPFGRRRAGTRLTMAITNCLPIP